MSQEPLLRRTLRPVYLSLTSPSYHTNTWYPVRMNTFHEHANLCSTCHKTGGLSMSEYFTEKRKGSQEYNKPISSTLPSAARAEGPGGGRAKTPGWTVGRQRGLCGEMDMGPYRLSCLPKLSEPHTGNLGILSYVSDAGKINSGKEAKSPSGSSARQYRESRLQPPHQIHCVEPCSPTAGLGWCLGTLHKYSPNKLLSDESVGSLGHHWGSWVGEAIQSGWGLLDGEGRLLELSLPFSFAGERGTPSPVNQNPESKLHIG